MLDLRGLFIAYKFFHYKSSEVTSEKGIFYECTITKKDGVGEFEYGATIPKITVDQHNNKLGFKFYDDNGQLLLISTYN